MYQLIDCDGKQRAKEFTNREDAEIAAKKLSDWEIWRYADKKCVAWKSSAMSEPVFE